MVKRILVGLVGTNYTPVEIERAVTLAKAHDAEVTGVTVLDARRVHGLGGAVPPPWVKADSIRGRRMAVSQAHIAESIHNFKVACQSANIKHGVVEETGDSFTRLVELARCRDLMVLGGRTRPTSVAHSRRDAETWQNPRLQSDQ